ncbi:MAG: type II toxin-antitoxin system Phd/YefM family antitoxin [Actinobacteria bacterium]|nr:type II toxin-antitoxin system Phd/YefM family antitoxin [Actinomycetota bacterium]
MIVNSTDLKNNLGKYLRDCAKEEIIITSNGRKIAILRSYDENENVFNTFTYDGVVSERESEASNIEPNKMSYEEFLDFSENTQKRYEYIDGEAYLLTAPGTRHQKVLGELYILFYNLFRGKKCIPLLAPYDITLNKDPDNINVVEPDLVVICDLEENLNEKDRYMGVPVLVAEILSESTCRSDLIKKLDLYMCSGVNEYWIVNPSNREITVYSFENKDIAASETFKNNETAQSYYFPDLKIKLKDIYNYK